MSLSKKDRERMKSKLAANVSIASSVDMKFMLDDLDAKDKEIEALREGVAELEETIESLNEQVEMAEHAAKQSNWNNMSDRQRQEAIDFNMRHPG